MFKDRFFKGFESKVWDRSYMFKRDFIYLLVDVVCVFFCSLVYGGYKNEEGSINNGIMGKNNIV